VTQFLGKPSGSLEVTGVSSGLKRLNTLIPCVHVLVVRLAYVRFLVLRSDVQHDVRRKLSGHRDHLTAARASRRIQMFDRASSGWYRDFTDSQPVNGASLVDLGRATTPRGLPQTPGCLALDRADHVIEGCHGAIRRQIDRYEVDAEVRGQLGVFGRVHLGERP
jgi:hypothetical protein